jgi:hypothetical protein
MSTTERPACCADEHLDYLDVLRESGVTNMFGAGPWLVNAFGVSRDESHKILGYWMDTFPRKKAEAVE